MTANPTDVLAARSAPLIFAGPARATRRAFRTAVIALVGGLALGALPASGCASPRGGEGPDAPVERPPSFCRDRFFGFEIAPPRVDALDGLDVASSSPIVTFGVFSSRDVPPALVAVQPVGRGLSEERFVERIQAAARGGGSTVTARRRIEVDGRACPLYAVRAPAGSGQSPMRGLVAGVLLADEAFVVTCQAAPGAIELYEPAFMKCIASLRPAPPSDSGASACWLRERGFSIAPPDVGNPRPPGGSVVVFDMPSLGGARTVVEVSLLTQAFTPQTLGPALTGALESGGATVRDTRETIVSGRPALRFDHDMPRGKPRPGRFSSLVVLDGARTFVVTAGGDPTAFDRFAPALRASLDSFALLEPPSAAPAPAVDAARGWSPLLIALSSGGAVKAKELILDGADPNDRAPDGRSALLFAAGWGMLENCRLLLERGADPDSRSAAGVRPLEACVIGGHAEIARLLVEEGAEIDARNARGRTALMEAAWHGQTDVARVLIDAGAAPDATDRNGATALIFGVIQDRRAIAELLLDRGAPIDQADQSGVSPLIIAADIGHRRIVEVLIARNADVSRRDRNGRTALAVARARGRDDIVSVLEKAGAR